MIKHLELFSGIGGFRHALDLLSKDFNLNVNHIGFSEIDKYAVTSYKAMFDTDNEIELGDIHSYADDLENIYELRGRYNFLTGGFPCQAFSMMGQGKGFKESRGSVFYNIIDLIKFTKPKFILLENVKNLLNHNKGQSLRIILKYLNNIGYKTFYDVFNTADFGLPQTRKRLFIFGTTEKTDNNFEFLSSLVKLEFDKIKDNTSLLRYNNVHQLLDKKANVKYYLSDKIKPTILSNGTGRFISKSEINQIIARPLTATMVKMHRACQDNYYNDGFLLSKNPYEYIKNNISFNDLLKHRIRRITPKEAFLLQGFSNDLFTKAANSGLSDFQLYKQSGNAVSINTVYAILYYLLISNNYFYGL